MIKNRKQFGAVLSIGLSCFLVLIKLLAGVLSGSVAVLASAVDSLIDVITGLLSYRRYLYCRYPPDEDHPFGHGKFEDFAGLMQAVLIIVGAFFIIWSATTKLINPASGVNSPVLGIIVMIVSLLLDLILSRVLFHIAHETESIALYADAHHLNTDVWSGVAVITGLVLVNITHNPIF